MEINNADGEIIPEIPDIPKEIKDAINNNNLAIFIGAGVSRLVGCKSWQDLAHNLLELCRDKGLLQFVEYNALAKDSDNKKLISIAYGLLKQGYESDFYAKLKEALTPNMAGNTGIFKNLSNLGTTFITTNADECFDGMFESAGNIVCDFTSQEVLPENRKLYHIHGSIKDKDSLVFTASQYLKRYSDTNFQRFLRKLFEKYVVLFIGYGLSEFELLDFLILKSNPVAPNIIPKHFTLMPYFSYEKAIAKHNDLYFKELNIQTIPYAIDKKGYEQLINIFDNWAAQICDNTFYFTNIIAELKAIIESSEDERDKANKILQLIKDNTVAFEEFIRLCQTTTRIANYMLRPLYERQYFSSNKNPEPEESKEQPGYYKIPNWPMMEFLKSYLNYVKETNDKTNFDVYKDIILSNVKDADSNHIDNYHTDSSLIEFIFSLEESDVNDECIKFIDSALHSKWGTLVVSSTIAEKVLPRLLEFTDKQKIKSILLVIFSFEPENSYSIKSLVDTYYLGIIFEKYFLRLYERLQSDFIEVFDGIIAKLKDKYFILVSMGFSRTEYPHVDSLDYGKTLLNCYAWFALRQENKKEFLEQRRTKTSANAFIDIVEKLLDSSINDDDFYSSTDWQLRNANDVNLPSDSSKNILASIKQLSSDENGDTYIEPFSRKIHNAVLQEPDMLINELDAFVNVHFAYIHQILSAYLSLLREQKFFKIKSVISFVSNITERQELWTEKKGRRLPNYELWTVHNVCDFISLACTNFSDRISQAEYELFKNIAIKVYNNLEQDEQEYSEMYSMMYMLNSESGKCFEALIRLYFFSALQSGKKYDGEIQAIFLKELDDKKFPVIYTALGAYFAGFYYRDKAFAETVYSKIFNIEDDKLKRSSLDGYLYSPYTSMTKDYYLYLKGKNFFVNLIDYVSEDKRWCSLIANTACASCMEGMEDFSDENSLIHKVVETNNVLYINSVVRYFFLLKQKADEKKIISIWTKICENLERYKDDPHYNECIIELLQFINSITYIDETVKRNIEFSIRYFPQTTVEFYMLDNLNRLYLCPKNQVAIIETLVKFTEANVFFYDYEGKLTHLFREIHKTYSDAALKLCNIYVQKGRETRFMHLLEEFKSAESQADCKSI